MKAAVLLLVLAFFFGLNFASGYSSVSLGDRLLRDYTKYIGLPITVDDATNNQWQQSSSYCDPNLGIAYTQYGASATSDYPITLYFTQSGSIAGIGATMYGTPPQQLISMGYWQEVSDGVYFISLTFRDSSEMCSNYYATEPLGDRLIVNANSIAIALPMTEEDAVNGQWTAGSCFYSMGYHYFYDLTSAPVMSWEAANLLPIVPMYSNGTINAIFFASSVVQQGLLSSHEWDGIPLPNLLMCKNWCDSSCTFGDTSIWSTMHIYFRDYTQATCPGGCTISCCSS
jgi:charged multivesicular body protein 7